MLHEKYPLCASPIFADIPSDIMPLVCIGHPWHITEETPEFTVITPHILIMSFIEGLKREIYYLKGEIINQLQYHTDKIGFYYMDKNTKTIIDAMASQSKHIK